MMSAPMCSLKLVGHEAGSWNMRPSEVLQSHRSVIRGVVAAHHACNARVFGSVLHGLDTEGSDLDILVDPTPETTLMDVAAIQIELERLLGVSVDVLTPRALPEKFRSTVLAEAMPV
jgi:predicted nucleotidyltransferase